MTAARQASGGLSEAGFFAAPAGTPVLAHPVALTANTPVMPFCAWPGTGHR
jgi:hypothetical protein